MITQVPVEAEVGIAKIVAELTGGQDAVVRARLRDVDVTCAIIVDVEEHSRRQTAGVGSISDRLVLNALMELDLGSEVSRGSLPDSTRRRLRREDAAATVEGSRSLTRLARPPLNVTLAVIADSQWARGLARATKFGPYCPRVLFMPRLPPDPTELLLEASYFGVGLAVPDEPHRLARAPFLPMRFTSSSWAFTEDAYAQFLDQTSSTFGKSVLTETRAARA